MIFKIQRTFSLQLHLGIMFHTVREAYIGPLSNVNQKSRKQDVAWRQFVKARRRSGSEGARKRRARKRQSKKAPSARTRPIWKTGNDFEDRGTGTWPNTEKGDRLLNNSWRKSLMSTLENSFLPFHSMKPKVGPMRQTSFSGCSITSSSLSNVLTDLHGARREGTTRSQGLAGGGELHVSGARKRDEDCE